MENNNEDFSDRDDEPADQAKQIVQMPDEARGRRTKPMNVAAADWGHAVPVLRATEKMLLLILASHSDQYGCSWCSQKTLAAETGCCDRTVRYSLKNFENRGLIRRIGRLGQSGGQITDVIMLVAWPERKLIPNTGHPRLGWVLRESQETKRQWAINNARKRAQLPAGPEMSPDQNKGILKNLTTAWLGGVLAACFDALGPWATSENIQLLTDDLRTLQGWLDLGLDLHRHVLPVLAEKAASKAPIPTLRTWRYFEVPIGKKASKKQRAWTRAKGMKPMPEASPPDTDQTSLSRGEEEPGA